LGIDVSASKFVTINDHHQHGVNTLVDKNPTRGRIGGIETLHVFKRNHLGNRDYDDGNPLIHALKGTGRYQIQMYWRQQFHNRANNILESCLAEIEKHDFLLSTPSSSPFCMEFTKQVSELSKVSILDSRFLKKQTVKEVLQNIHNNPPKVKRSLETTFKDEVAKLGRTEPNNVFQTKLVANRVRTLFRFFKVVGTVPNIQDKRIMIVDDLLATGSSLFSMREILQNQHGASVSFLSYLSNA